MTINIIPDTFDPQLYNSVVDHPLQSWEWGEARKATGVEILRIGEFNGSDLKKAFLMTLHNIPFTRFKIGYIPKSDIPSKALLDFLKEIALQNNLIFIKIEPYVFKSEVRNPRFARRAKFEMGSASSPYPEQSRRTNSKFKILNSKHPLFPQWTIISDISKDENKLMASLKPKTRYNINLAQKKGVYVKEESSQRGYEIFEKLYFETITRQKYKGHDVNYHRKNWEMVKGKLSRILIAYLEKEPLAAYHLFLFKNRCFYVYGGSSDKFRNSMASNLLMWESLLFAKRNGCDSFDMWGSLSKDYSHSHKWAGFTRFKEGYGGEFVEMVGSYDLVAKPVLYNLYNLAYSVREMLLKI